MGENFHSEQDVDPANQFDDEAWGLEDILSPVDQSTIGTREALVSLGIKYRSSRFPVPGTPIEIIRFESEGMDIRVSSATAERECLQKLLETFESRVATLDRELVNCRTDVNELAATKRALDDMVIAVQTRLDDVNDVSSVQGARRSAFETE